MLSTKNTSSMKFFWFFFLCNEKFFVLWMCELMYILWSVHFRSLLFHDKQTFQISWFIALTLVLGVYQTQILQIIWLNVNEFACLSLSIRNLLNICNTFEENVSLCMTKMQLVQIESNLERSSIQNKVFAIDCSLEFTQERPFRRNLKV